MFKVGQKVWCVMFGEGMVTEVLAENTTFPVEVRFGGVLEYYTLDGKYRTYSLQTLFPYQVEIVKKVVKPSIDWEHVESRFKFLAEDFDGAAFLYENEPRAATGAWGMQGGETLEAYVFASYTKGACDWKDSLIKRPEVK